MTNLDLFNTALAVISFLLTIILSYGRLKVLTYRAAKSSTDTLRKWAMRRDDHTAFLVAHPSGFLAYCVKRFIIALGLLFLIPYFTYFAKANPWDLPLWAASALGKAAPILCGALLGMLMVRADEVLDRIKKTEVIP